MQHFWSLNGVNLNNAWLTIGSFDGVHLGHQAIINELTAGAHSAGQPAVVLTFFPHPVEVLRQITNPIYLTTPEVRAKLLGDLGVDYVITYPFTREVANLPGKEFLKQINYHLNIHKLQIGTDFAMGINRDTDSEALQIISRQMGFQLQVVGTVNNSGQRISSSRIRSLLIEGEVQRVNDMLGRPYRIEGMVIVGDGRGRTIGIPTANLSVWEKQVLPGRGVYACKVELDGRFWQAATNIGTRPTFDGNQSTTIETHLLDFDGNLYGRSLKLDFVKRLRGEQRFPSIEALVEQIHMDITRTREVLKDETVP